MRILFCGLTFARAPKLLRELLPDDAIMSLPDDQVKGAAPETDVLIPLMHRLDADLIEITTARLIHQWGVGLEGVDIAAATKRGIMVCNVPGDITPNADSTAEHAIFLMMALARRIHDCFAAFDTGEWGWPMGETLMGNTALIVGLGRVGQALALKLKCLGMVVNAIRRTRAPELESALGLRRAGDVSNLYDFAAEADFVISTVSVNEQSRNMFDGKLFAAMKPTAFALNVSRGPVVNERDLIEALTNNTIAGAGLDVYAQEPVDKNNPLLSMKNVVATPHVAGATRKNYDGVAAVVAANLKAFKNGIVPDHCVNRSELNL
jgi:phosphoglycerate dehydrogenase-like enzyme